MKPKYIVLLHRTDFMLPFAFSAFSPALSSMIGTLTGKGAAADELLVIMLCHVIIMSHHPDMAWLCVNCYMCYVIRFLLHVILLLSSACWDILW